MVADDVVVKIVCAEQSFFARREGGEERDGVRTGENERRVRASVLPERLAKPLGGRATGSE